MRVRHRLLLALTTAGLAGAVLVAVGTLALSRSAVRDRSTSHIRAQNQLLSSWLETLPADTDLQAFVERAGADLDMRVTLIDESGRVLADSARSRTSLSEMSNHLDRPEVQAARTRGFGEAFRVSATTNVEYFYSARRMGGSGPVTFVRTAVPVDEVQRTPPGMTSAVFAVVTVTMLVLVIVSYVAVRRLSRPLEKIAGAVERSAVGEFDLELPRDQGEEMTRLTSTLEGMRNALLKKIAELEQERTVLESVVSGMKEGLMLVGPDRRVRLANRALARILDLSLRPEGHLLEEVIRQPRVLSEIERALADGREIREATVTLPGSNRTFELHVTPLSEGEGPDRRAALLLFFDITRMEMLERVRREFVANVSHELRTPLTSIKAFVENLIDAGLEDRENALRFLEIVRRHADRMGALIEDITELSLIESGAIALELRQLDVGDVARELIEPFRPLAANRKVDLVVELPRPFPLSADRRRLEQMLTNLLDNAIKFNREGGTVTVRGRRDDDAVRISVADTGIGIPADSREKVFQRFFQVNRDRSRAAGGTGLGLSIVKHLMRVHGGRVEVESHLGEGAVFTLVFPHDRVVSRSGATTLRPAESPARGDGAIDC